jgi:hypothetical protein
MEGGDMSEKAASGEDDLLNDPEFLRFFQEYDTEGIAASGAIPEGHDGPYVPSVEELVQAIREGTDARLRAIRAREKIATERAPSLIEPEKGAQ